MNLVDFKMAFVDYKAAKYACEHWHYSKSVPVSKNIYIGIWEKNRYIGCIIYGLGVASNLHKRYNIKYNEVCELVRIALNKHKNSVSKYISISLKILKKKCPNLKLIVSFADRNHNHLGIIYQATNWIYTGETIKTKEYIASNGKKYHNRAIRESGIVNHFNKYKRCYKPSECKQIILLPKYRYIMPLNKEIRKQLIKLAKPYPKKCGDGVKIA